MHRRLTLLVALGGIAALAVFAWHRMELPPFDGSVHAATRAESAAMLPVLQRAAERDVQILGEPARTNFCALHLYGTDHPLAAGKRRFVYAYANCSGIHPRRGGAELAFAEGIETPVRFTVRGAGAELAVTALATPGDGGAYGEDIDRLFPRKVERQILSGDSGVSAAEDPDCTNLRAAQRRFGLREAEGVDRFEPRSIEHCASG